MDFVILKVNGQDLSKATHEEAIRAFQMAEEPITVEVLRRNTSHVVPVKTVGLQSDADESGEDAAERYTHTEPEVEVTQNNKEEIKTNSVTGNSINSLYPASPIVELVSTAVQTDWVGLWNKLPECNESNSSNGLFPVFPDLVLPSSQHPSNCETDYVGETVKELDNIPERGHDDSFEDFLAQGMEYEEVVLQRNSSQDKLGLTLCYSPGAEANEMELYIGEIDMDSIAGKDGTLRVGDQILQINGVDIRDKEQAESLFAETQHISLLISRTQLQVPGPDQDEGGSVENASNPSHQDSGMGQDSLKNEESSEHETQDNERAAEENESETHNSGSQTQQSGVMVSMETGENEEAKSPDGSACPLTDVAKVQNLQQTEVRVADGATGAVPSTLVGGNINRDITFNRCLNNEYDLSRCINNEYGLNRWNNKNNDTNSVSSEPGHFDSNRNIQDNSMEEPVSISTFGSQNLSGSYQSCLKRLESETSIDRELYQLNKKMEHIRLECEYIAARHKYKDKKTVEESEAEHIYETIPENTESDDPVYSVPYESETMQRAERMNLWKQKLSECKGQKGSPKRNCEQPMKNMSSAKRILSDKQRDVEDWVFTSGIVNNQNSKIQEVKTWLNKTSEGDNKDSLLRGSSRNDNCCNPIPRERKISGGRNKVKNKLKLSKTVEDTSSAYNTGDSNMSTPGIKLEFGNKIEEVGKRVESSNPPLSPIPIMEDRAMQVNLDADTYSVISCDSCHLRMAFDQFPTHPSVSAPSSPRKGKGMVCYDFESNKNYVTTMPTETMYTNVENLHQTIRLQQQMFREALLKQHKQKSSSLKSTTALLNDHLKKQSTLPPYIPSFASSSGYTTPNLSQYQFVSSPYGVINSFPAQQQVSNKEESPMVWKVKRRPDGTRYITRRPIRNQLLKDRAMKINEERTGLTTDEDAMSELKTGRYWSKEDRKRHLEKAREKRRRQEAIIRAKMETMRDKEELVALKSDEKNNTKSPKKKEMNTADMNQPKLPRKKNGRGTADDFTTMEDLVANGSRGDQEGKMMGLLSVTTV